MEARRVRARGYAGVGGRKAETDLAGAWFSGSTIVQD